MGYALVCLFAVSYLARAQEPTAEARLGNLHREAQEQPVHDRLSLLYDLAIAATGVDPALSAEWSLEMYHLATKDTSHEQPWRDQLAMRKNALTVLSLTDPERAARHFMELEPSADHQPNEDPRIDLARHLFPRLWERQAKQALPAILRFADFTSRTGQYPYVAIGHILPGLANVDRAAAHALFVDAVHRLAGERGIWRTPDDYLQFLRESWLAASAKERRLAVEAALAVVYRGIADKANAYPGSRSYAEYYLPRATVRLGSEEEERIYDLLPFADAIDADWGRKLRRPYPALANVEIPAVDAAPWRSGVFAAAGRDRPELVQAAFERHHLMFLPRWASQDPKRAAAIAEGTMDAARRHAAMALVLPWLAKVDPPKAETWLQELSAVGHVAETPDDLEFLVALARAHFALGHFEDGRQVAAAAMKVGEQLVTNRDQSRPLYSAEGANELHDLAAAYGESDHLAELVRLIEDQAPGLRLFLLAGGTRAALRHRPGYQEPN
jgi:hypothetical protein